MILRMPLTITVKSCEAGQDFQIKLRFGSYCTVERTATQIISSPDLKGKAALHSKTERPKFCNSLSCNIVQVDKQLSQQFIGLSGDQLGRKSYQ